MTRLRRQAEDMADQCWPPDALSHTHSLFLCDGGYAACLVVFRVRGTAQSLDLSLRGRGQQPPNLPRIAQREHAFALAPRSLSGKGLVWEGGQRGGGREGEDDHGDRREQGGEREGSSSNNSTKVF